MPLGKSSSGSFANENYLVTPLSGVTHVSALLRRGQVGYEFVRGSHKTCFRSVAPGVSPGIRGAAAGETPAATGVSRE